MSSKKYLLKFGEKFWLYGILAFGFLLRIFYIFNFTTPEKYLFSDPGGYDARALFMAQDQYIASSTYWAPFFHIFLSFIYRPLVWLDLESWRIKIDVVLFAVFYTIAFWCIYQIAKKLFSQKTAFIILAALIFWWPFIFFNSLIMSENLFFLLFFFGLYVLIEKPKSSINGILLGILWGLALLTRPIFAPTAALFLLWALIEKIGWKYLLSFAASAGLMVILMMAFNFNYTKGLEKSISSNGGVAFAMTWCDAKFIGFRHNNYVFVFGPPANINYPDSKGFWTDVPFENQSYYYKMGTDCIKKNHWRLVDNFSSVMKLFDSAFFPADINVFGWDWLRSFFKNATNLLFFTSMITLLLPQIPFSKNMEDKKYFYLMGLIVLSLLLSAYGQSVGEERYFIPYVPLLMMMSVPFFSGLIKFIKTALDEEASK